MQNKPTVQKTYSQKCAACGGDLVFNPKKQMLECVQCGTVLPINSTRTTEKSFEQLLKDAPTWKNETVVYHCEHCGAKAVVAKNSIAVKCDYCGANNIVKIEDLPGIRPDTVVAFKITKAEAISRARRWLSRRFFAPRWYKKTVQPENVSGIYFPAFTFDAQTISIYRGIEVRTHTRTVMRDGKTYTKTYTTRHPFSGTLERTFDDVLVPAAETIAASSFAKLKPFSTNQGAAYQKEFLSGFTASHYTKDAEHCWQEAKKMMNQEIRREIIARKGGTVEGLVVETTTSNITYKYALLPVYLGHSEYKGKKYDLYINGETGKVFGNTPVSWGKVFLTVAATLVAVGAAILFALSQ